MTTAEHDNAFWRQVLADNDRWLRASLFVRLGRQEAVEEVMQEVALAAFRDGRSLRDRRKAAPWLYRVALRQALLYRRSQGRRRQLARDYFADRGRESVENDALDWLLASERAALVRRGLQELPRRDAEVLLLKYGEGWSYRQIANKLGISVSAVEARLHRARKRLRGKLTTLGAVEATPS